MCTAVSLQHELCIVVLVTFLIAVNKCLETINGLEGALICLMDRED